MAAQDNPFYIQPANPLQALMTGVAGYDRSAKAAKEQEVLAGRQDAMAALQGGGDTRGALARLIGIGDVQGAKAISDYANQQAVREQARLQLDESSRHNRAIEGQSAATLAETRRQHETTPVKLGTTISGDVYGVRDRTQPGGFRVIDPNSYRAQGQAAPQGATSGPPPFAGGVPFVGDAGAPSTAMPPQAPPQSPQQPEALTGEDFLRTLPADVRPLVKGVAKYEISPTTFSNRGQRERILAAVKQYDPNFDEIQYGERATAIKRLSTGPQGDTLRSMNVGIDHLHTLEEYATALNNGNVQLLNSARAKFQQQFGMEAPSNFNAVKAIVGSEVSKAIVGSRGALQDREEIKADLKVASSPQQLLGIIKAYKKLMAGQVMGLKQQYESSGLKDFHKRLTPNTIKELGLDEGGNPAAPAAGGVVDWRTFFGAK